MFAVIQYRIFISDTLFTLKVIKIDTEIQFRVKVSRYVKETVKLPFNTDILSLQHFYVNLMIR